MLLKRLEAAFDFLEFFVLHLVLGRHNIYLNLKRKEKKPNYEG